MSRGPSTYQEQKTNSVACVRSNGLIEKKRGQSNSLVFFLFIENGKESVSPN